MNPGDSRLNDPDSQEPSPYLRGRRRVEVRRSAVRWRRALIIGGIAAFLACGAVAAAALGVSTYVTSSPRFALRSEIAFAGANHVTTERLAEFFARDVGRSLLDLPLDRRRAELMSLPWVESASVMRSWPDRLLVQIHEREPVAFARVAAPGAAGSGRLALIDREGVLLPLLKGGKFPFAVLAGVSEQQTPADRRKRVTVMLAMLGDLDRGAPPHSGDVSEVDLSDPEDAAATVAHGDTAVLVHLGNGHFLERYKLFLDNIDAWREQYGSVRSVDLRYDKQVVVQP